MLLTAFDHRPLGLWQPEFGPRFPRTVRDGGNLIESPGAPRDPPGGALADHRAGFVARADGRP